MSDDDWNPYHTPTQAMDELTKQNQDLNLGYSRPEVKVMALPKDFWFNKFNPVFNAWSYNLEAGLTQEQRKQFMQEIIDVL